MLRYRGVVEWGFTRWALADLLVRGKPLVRETSPFADKTARRGVLWLEVCPRPDEKLIAHK